MAKASFAMPIELTIASQIVDPCHKLPPSFFQNIITETLLGLVLNNDKLLHF